MAERNSALRRRMEKKCRDNAVIVVVVTPNPMGDSSVECYWTESAEETSGVLQQQLNMPSVIVCFRVSRTQHQSAFEAFLPDGYLLQWDDTEKDKLINDLVPVVKSFYESVTGLSLQRVENVNTDE
jgi:hypothetical protein